MAAKTASRRAVPAADDLDAELDRIAAMPIEELRRAWRFRKASEPPAAFSRDLLARALAYDAQEQQLGGLGSATRKLLASALTSGGGAEGGPRRLKPGSILVREHDGVVHEVMVLPDGYLWSGQTYASLSTIARRITGVSWSGPRFFGLLQKDSAKEHEREDKSATPGPEQVRKTIGTAEAASASQSGRRAGKRSARR